MKRSFFVLSLATFVLAAFSPAFAEENPMKGMDAEKMAEMERLSSPGESIKNWNR